MNFGRIMRHLLYPDWWVLGRFPKAMQQEIEHAITASEHSHRGELRFVAEAGLALDALLADQAPRTRALELFGQLGVWDTEHNSGVLIYVLLADRQVEILADRGINRKVGEATWQAICQAMETAFRDGRFHAGALAGVQAISQVLTTHFPAHGPNPDELPNAAIIL